MTDQTTNLTPQQTLKNMRIMWFAMLMGQVLFAAVVIGLSLTSEPESFESVKIIYMVAVVWGLMSVPISAFIRMQIYKKNWVENCVTPKGYASGMILSMAMIEGAALVSLVPILLHRTLGPTFALPVALIAVFAMNFPNGKAMEPANPEFMNNQPPDLLNK